MPFLLPEISLWEEIYRNLARIYLSQGFGKSFRKPGKSFRKPSDKENPNGNYEGLTGLLVNILYIYIIYYIIYTYNKVTLPVTKLNISCITWFVTYVR